jgi:hypothetical protein
MFQQYFNSRRKNLNGSQSETSTFNVSNDTAIFNGYQHYKVKKILSNMESELQNNIQIEFINGKQQKQCELINTIDIKPNTSILDLGCSNGVIGLYTGFQKKSSKIYLHDHDKECVNNIQKLINWLNNSKIETKQYTFSTTNQTNEKYDYIITLSTLHWFYSATADFGCLFSIIQKLKEMTNIALIVEWVNPNDPAIKCLNHINMNKSIHKTDYSKDNFLKALETSFSSYKKIGDTTSHRELYIAYI